MSPPGPPILSMNAPSPSSASGPPRPGDILSIERPHPRLMVYYFLVCLLALPLFPILIVIHYFRYYTLRYRFDDEGVSMKWGILFRHEVSLNYARIQDIHLHSNLVERWLGLGRVLVQPASGSASAEMKIEGLLEFEAVRDFLYERMRGAKEKGHGKESKGESATSAAALSTELVTTLRQVAEEVRLLRETIERQRPS